MSEIKFGVFDHIERRNDSLDRLYQGRLELLREYDAAGFFCYHVAEHHATPLGMAPSPGIFLAAAAQCTRQIHLGPLVYLLPLYNPLRLISEICMLDHISNGRLEIGVGRGVSPFELAYYGISFMDSREIFDEALDVIVDGLRNERLSHRGPHYRFDSVPMELTPKQRPNPPFWYGVSTPESLMAAARRGMNMVTLGPTSMVKDLGTRYREEVARHKGGPGETSIPKSPHRLLVRFAISMLQATNVKSIKSPLRPTVPTTTILPSCGSISVRFRRSASHRTSHAPARWRWRTPAPLNAFATNSLASLRTAIAITWCCLLPGADWSRMRRGARWIDS